MTFSMGVGWNYRPGIALAIDARNPGFDRSPLTPERDRRVRKRSNINEPNQSARNGLWLQVQASPRRLS
jgi:hypothetical protein